MDVYAETGVRMFFMNFMLFMVDTPSPPRISRSSPRSDLNTRPLYECLSLP